MPLRVAELETLFTANVDGIAKGEAYVKQVGQRIESKPIKQKVDGDAKGALASMDRVEQQAKRIVSQRTVATVDANIERSEKAFVRVKERLDYLRSVDTELDVNADIARAEAQMQKVERQLKGLRSARAVMEVDANTVPAEDALSDAADAAGDSGADAGEQFGAEIIAALAAIPIAGAVVALGAAAAKALLNAFDEGLQQEAGRDRLQALTGISEVAAQRLGSLAGEAYANTFGESVEQNMDTARLALQFNIIDGETASRDAQSVIEGLAGISDVLGEDVRPVAAAVATMLRTGIAKNSKEAFDLFAAGARNGVNRAEDLLDTFTEYPALFARLGLSGEEALGLLNQGLEAGARNSDLAADALKEFQIRATDGTDASAAGFQMLGFNAEQMTAKIAKGGKAAREGLAEVLDELRRTEDPVKRNAAAVALFGTQAEDLGDALFAMDLSTAVDELDGVKGAAQEMFDTLSGNDASKVERAKRNIEVAVDGIQGALATAFSEPLGDFADWVSTNRGPLLQFFADMLNGAIDFAIGSTEAFGEFVSGPLASVVDGLAGVIDFFNGNEERPKELDDLAESMRGFDERTEDAVSRLEDMRGQFNGFADGQIALGYLNDASIRLAESIGKVGDGSASMESQVRDALQALREQGEAAAATGEDQKTLAQRYKDGESALVDQMEQMGMTRAEARKLIDTVKKGANGELTFDSNTAAAQAEVDTFINRNNGRRIVVTVDAEGGNTYQVAGTNIRYRAGGGEVTGPGGPKDDEIPAMLSNGEHVLTADEVVKAGGQGQIYALRSAIRSGQLQRVLRGQIPGFASGGAVSRMLLDWTRSQRRGENREAGMNGNALSLVDELFKVIEVSSKRAQGRLRNEAVRSERQLQRLEKAGEAAEKKLDKARDRLASLRDTVESFASGISSVIRRAFDVSSWGSLGSKPTTQTRQIDGSSVTTVTSSKTTLTAASIAKDAKTKASAIKRFAGKLEQLAKKRFDPALIAELAGLGVEEGEPVVDALLKATKAEVESINSSYKTSDKYADKAGDQVAMIQIDPETKQTYAKLISTAEKQVRDAKKNADDIRAALSREVDRIIRTITSGLKAAPKKASGGRISGPGGPTDDAVLLWGSNDEHMWTAAEVKGAGGHSRVEALRRAALTGQLGSIPAYATGGPVTTTGGSFALAAASSTAQRPEHVVNVSVVQNYPVADDPEQRAWEAAQIVAGAAMGGSDV